MQYRLINIITFLYLILTLAGLLISGLFIYLKIESEIDFETGRELDRQVDSVADQIRRGNPYQSLITDQLEIDMIPFERPVEELYLRDTLAYHESSDRKVKQLKASKSYKIGGEHYRISYFNIVVETDDITETVVFTMGVVFLLQLAFIVFFLRGISNRILLPFQKSLKKIQNFNFAANEPFVFEKSNIKEFDQLNEFLMRMSNKLLKDYRQIKEYSENISHEIQTPTTVIRGKLEHLMNEGMTEKQSELIHSAYQNNERIQRIVKSLSLLAKLENNEFESPQAINFSDVLLKNIELTEELIEGNGLQLEQSIDPEVTVVIHPFTADVMIQNLISNAVKHNQAQGWIKIQLNSDYLWVENSGSPLKKDPEVLLKRFEKESDKSDSIGLGLAIVSQICKSYGLNFQYSSEGNLHSAKISFR
ncbi:sensor histidine kinase [Algoriphagus halophilus]|uniref:histidine kinase n=1 Tax=Algoriphagus halophilus TaxID=226505 RepID=A0A1N6DHP0_9BACT|nr:HAMP domain-containing sensor histidine kinase [Algoriphagus halophilus]SIN70278.1 Signal transduction histidine kinase [Algoriphagus halophilus]